MIGIAVQYKFQILDFLTNGFVAPGLRRLPFERPHLALDFYKDVFHPFKIGLCEFNFPLRSNYLFPVFCDSRGLFQHDPGFFRLLFYDRPDPALTDDRIGLVPQAGIHKDFLDIFQPAGHVVDPVLAFPGTE